MALKDRAFTGSSKVLIVLILFALITAYFAFVSITQNGISPISFGLLVLSGLPIYYWLFKSA